MKFPTFRGTTYSQLRLRNCQGSLRVELRFDTGFAIQGRILQVLKINGQRPLMFQGASFWTRSFMPSSTERASVVPRACEDVDTVLPTAHPREPCHILFRRAERLRSSLLMPSLVGRKLRNIVMVRQAEGLRSSLFMSSQPSN